MTSGDIREISILSGRLLSSIRYWRRSKASLKEVGKSVGKVFRSISSSFKCSAASFEKGKELMKIFSKKFNLSFNY
jgi:hypothetical protein